MNYKPSPCAICALYYWQTFSSLGSLQGAAY